ncbi:phosphotyrosine-specific ptp2-like protein [Tieghemiomyces parasiticus]|uniref:protein-tyrosine-phosphatase n=1 Tax=Tieghemiomyces parasiticus TaxID=78921 RepID=A0A9W8A0C8_9FUNG|nr:phosphotyrosine-specific ptp2-like protein [Tieghemiomyces parasiticus]
MPPIRTPRPGTTPSALDTPYFTPYTHILSPHDAAAPAPAISTPDDVVIPTGPCTPRFYTRTPPPGDLSDEPTGSSYGVIPRPRHSVKGAGSLASLCPAFPGYTPSTLAQLLQRAHGRGTVGDDDHASRPSPAVLLLDTRIPSHFTRQHVRGALNVSVPSTLIKRPGFTLDRIASLLSDPDDRAALEAWTSCTHVVVMDQNSVALTEQGVVTHLCQKFVRPGSPAHVGWLRGGFDTFVRRFPELCSDVQVADETTPPVSVDASQPPADPVTIPPTRCPTTTSSGVVGVLPPRLGPLTGRLSGTRNRPLDAFFMSFRHNNEPKTEAALQVRLRGPVVGPLNDVSAPPSLPAFLARVANETPDIDGVSPYLTAAFTALERTENERLRAMFTNSSCADDQGPFSITHGLRNGTRNRYHNIMPYDATRVCLAAGTTATTRSSDDDYINASYIASSLGPRRYISTQGPLPSTVADFWSMIVEQRTAVVIMLTRESERGRPACHRYWPTMPQLATRVGPQVAVTLVMDLTDPADPDLALRLFRLHTRDEPARLVIQLQYAGWPDFGAPESPRGVLRLRDLTDAATLALGVDDDVPILVHCSAGCGRTGAFCAIDTVAQWMRDGGGQTTMDVDGTDDASSDPVVRAVGEFRERRTYMVQNALQFGFCYEALLHEAMGHYCRDVTLADPTATALRAAVQQERHLQTSTGGLVPLDMASLPELEPSPPPLAPTTPGTTTTTPPVNSSCTTASPFLPSGACASPMAMTGGVPVGFAAAINAGFTVPSSRLPGTPRPHLSSPGMAAGLALNSRPVMARSSNLATHPPLSNFSDSSTSTTTTSSSASSASLVSVAATCGSSVSSVTATGPSSGDYFSFPPEQFRRPRLPLHWPATSTSTITSVASGSCGAIRSRSSGLMSPPPLPAAAMPSPGQLAAGTYVSSSLSPSLTETLLNRNTNLSSPLSSPNG